MKYLRIPWGMRAMKELGLTLPEELAGRAIDANA